MTLPITLLKQKKVWFVLIIVLLSAYLFFRSSGTEEGENQYITSTVEKGSISVTVSGNGQVISSEDIEIKARASGEISSLNMTKGATVEKNTLLAQIDDLDAQRNVRDAQIDLENTQLELDKLYEPPTALEIKRAESDIAQAENSLSQLDFNYNRDKQDLERQITKLETDLPHSYENAFNAITSVFIDLPYIMGDLEDLIYNKDYHTNETNLVYYLNRLDNDGDITEQKERVLEAYQKAYQSYKDTLKIYQNTVRSDTEVLNDLTQQTYDAAYDCSQALKELNTFLTISYDHMTMGQKNMDLSTLLEHLDIVSKNMSTINPYLTNIFDNLESVRDLKDDIENTKTDLANLDTEYEINRKTSELSLEEKKQDLEELKAGPDDLDVKTVKIKLMQKENSLTDARADLADYSVYLPFDAIISDVSVKKGDLVSSSTTLGTAISLNKLAEITLNEIDIVNVHVGQKAILTFDALDDFSLTGEVAEVDAVGNVEQGVVSYGVTIRFDLDEDRIRPGMSVEVTLLSDSSQDTLIVPNTAVKTQNGQSYVEVLENDVPVRKSVETGLTSDTMTEILSGLTEGETIITNTLSSGTSSTSTGSSRGSFGGAGMIMGSPPR